MLLSALRIRHFEERDLASCIQFHQQVFDSQSEQSEIESWLRWTIDSYRELANLSQPPYADYAVELKDSGEFVGAAGIVPTVVPWGALTGNPADNLLSPEVGLFWGIYARLSTARLCQRSGGSSSCIYLRYVEAAAGGGDDRA